jgi:lysyl-tRNA synthetase, class II
MVRKGNKKLYKLALLSRSMDEYMKQRIKKLEELRDKGIDVYPNYFDKKDDSIDILEKYGDLKEGDETKTNVSIAGRIMTFRPMGKAGFAHLQDEKGKIQVYVRADEIGKDAYEVFSKSDLGDIVGVKGIVFKTKKGEVSVKVKEFVLLAKGIKPLPEKWHGLKDKEVRYRKRYLDLIVNPDVRKTFVMRSKIIDIVRELLKGKGYLEVETPTLQSIYGGASARPFKTFLNELKINLYLSISPELYLKRLVVGGFEKVFTICKNFRNEGIDKQHNPEFTMLEYYCAYENYEYHMKFTEELFNLIRKRLDIPEKIKYQEVSLDLKTPFKRIKFRDLLLKEINIDINVANNFEKLEKEIKAKELSNVDVNGCTHYGALLDELYKRVVRPKIIQPTFLLDYPVEMIALAKRNKEDPSKINSVQLLINGAEVLKAYEELNDPIDQDNRLKEQQKLLRGGDDEAMPMDEDFVESMQYGLPPTAGYGLGIDRIVALLTDSPSIRDVILFPFMKPEKA